MTEASMDREMEQRAEDAGERVGEASEAAALYPGDAGLLPEPARRALVQLLIGPSLDARRHSRLWPALLRHRELIRSRLSDLFLELIVDEDRQVAFTRQADTGELEAPILLRRSPLTFLDSALLLFLRQVLVEADTRAEPALVSLGDMEEQLRLFEPGDNTDRAGFDKRIRAAIEKAKKNSLIGAIRGSEDRFEVSATLKLLFGAEEIATLTRIYEKLNKGADSGGSTETPS
jgi:hypothetical protein